MILTIGHSIHPIEKFLGLLQAHSVSRVVDVRTIPRSRRNPQFNQDSLGESLGGVGIDYVHMPGLGGLRKPAKDSINTGWRNESFRGYADHMQTPEFERDLLQLIDLSQDRRCAIMCAESLPWRCHRSLIADALVARGLPVEHIMTEKKREIHTMTPFARVNGTTIIYP